MMYLGDFPTSAMIDFNWSSNSAAGASITRATNGTVSVYKANGTTQSTSGVTDTEDFDTLTGIHHCRIDTSSDGTFYAAGSEFSVVLSAATIDGQTVNAVLAHFSIERSGGPLALLKNGTYGLSALATAVTAVDDYVDTEMAAVLAAVDTEVAAIKTKTDYLPSATAGAAGGLFIAGSNAATTVNFTGNLSGSVGSVTGNVGGNVTGSVGSVAAGGITATSVATGAIDADALAADAVDEILDEVVEGSLTVRQVLRLVLAAVAGKASGGGTTTITFRDNGDTKDRISATVDSNGNRSAVTLDAS